jgi:hypothetical protein
LTVLLPVVAQTEEDPRWSDLDPRLPKPPCLIIFNGSMKSGKTVDIINMIYNPNFYHDKFDTKVYMSPSLEEDDNLEYVMNDDSFHKITGDRLHDADSILVGLCEAQRERVKEAKRQGKHPPHMLIVLDDMLGLLGEKFKYLCTKLRQPRITIFLSCQNFRSINKVVRENAFQYCLFPTSDKKELKKYEEEFGNTFPNFLELYRQATNERYSFLRLDRKEARAYKRFDQLIYDKWADGERPAEAPTEPDNEAEDQSEE